MTTSGQRGRWCRQLISVVVLATAVTTMAATPALADEVAFTISDERITESSGLAADTCGNRYWTANDSDAAGTAFALGADGSVQGTLTYPAKPVDVEAVAVNDCRLYLADIGDNGAQRDLITVYWFEDPAPGQERSNYRSYDFRYPDGAHDAEAFVIDAAGRFTVVTKEAKGGIYQAPADLVVQGVNELTRVADAPPFVTDATTVGDQLVLRTYVSVVTLDQQYQTVGSATVPLQQQGESVAQTLDGKNLLIGSEGSPAPVLRVPVPAAKTEVPAGPSSPPPTAAPATSSAPKPSETATEPVDAGSERTLTWVALGIAAALALLAGAGAYLAGGRSRRGSQLVDGHSIQEQPEPDEPEQDKQEPDQHQEYGDGDDEDSPIVAAPAPVIPDPDEDLDHTRNRGLFDSLFRRRSRDAAEVTEDGDADETVEASHDQERPSHDQEMHGDETAGDEPVEETEQVVPRRAIARADLDPATRAWLDAAFYPPREDDAKPKRARDD